MTPLFEDVPTGADIPIESIPGCAKVRYERVTQPAFLDHNGDALCVKTHKFATLDELRDYLLENDGKIYVLKCWESVLAEVPEFKDMETRPKFGSVFYLRSALASPLKDSEWFLATATPVMMHGSEFRPFKEVICRVRIDKLQDIKTSLGAEKLAERIGDIVLKAISEKKDALRV